MLLLKKIQKKRLLTSVCKQSIKELKKYNSRVKFLNDFSSSGANVHECLVVNSVLYNKTFEEIQRTLIFTDSYLIELLKSIKFKLKHLHSNKKLMNVLNK